MAPFLFRCPLTRMRVQGFYEEDSASQPEEQTGRDFISVECLSCGGAHMVDPTTGKVLGHDDG